MQWDVFRSLSMNRGLAHVAGCFVNGGLADHPFPLTPTLSLGERGNATFKLT